MSSPNDFSNLPMIEYLLATLNQMCNSSPNVTLESFNQFCNNINQYFSACPQLANSTDPLSKETWLIWLNYVGRISPNGSSVSFPVSTLREESNTNLFEQIIPTANNINISNQQSNQQNAVTSKIHTGRSTVPTIINTRNHYSDDASAVSFNLVESNRSIASIGRDILFSNQPGGVVHRDILMYKHLLEEEEIMSISRITVLEEEPEIRTISKMQFRNSR